VRLVVLHDFGAVGPAVLVAVDLDLLHLQVEATRRGSVRRGAPWRCSRGRRSCPGRGPVRRR
jgi:hypothetical protein